MSTNNLSKNEITMLKLIERSKDIGDGWRQASDQLWPHVVKEANKNLTELDHHLKRVRFNYDGNVVMKYLV
ncbi:hypothetical protein SUFG_00073 [Sulfitobacter phage phiCB2047-B]|uniref:Uncharacterized protein n=1 Tax=Sulfitobacter phage phiCB2047-B TaxID=754046 RepID=M4PQR0_9CAUD|nr:hypothetical protein SUFG_00073 [Sulfitobacter phage phiCB2047-B]AGH07440.1 hypothetical protein SUFG_00073 [Sulfitobacter phage phiCB2047-B]